MGKTANRVIDNDQARSMLVKFIENKNPPFVVSITDGKPRSNAQNRLSHMWMNEISDQKGDISPEEARAYCKLTIGIPILRSQNEAFRERYDEILKPLSYEQKLAIMSEPLNLPVTSLMSTKQLTEYLEAIIRHFGEQGIILTMPDDLRDQFRQDTDDAQSPAPSSDAAGEADPPSPASPAGTIIDAAKEMLTLAGLKYDKAKDRDDALHQCLEQWEKLLPDNRPQTDDIFMAVSALFRPNPQERRTIEEARVWLSKRLGATIQELSA